MLRQVFQTIRERRLWPEGAHLVVGVSGGADSVALLHALHHWQRKHRLALTVAHLHHGIRGAAADEDRDAVRLLAWKLGAPCVDDEVDVPAGAPRDRVSVEMAARQARHAFFRRVIRDTGADAVALAHTADDEAETLVLRLLRGSGTQGLGGIAASTEIAGLRIVRPLCEVTRAEIEGFLRAHGIAWREDATNRDLSIPRNRVRHELLPLLERSYQPAIRRVLSRTAALLRDQAEALEPLVARAWLRARREDVALDARGLRRCPPAVRRMVLMRWLRERGVPEERLDMRLVSRADALLDPGGPDSIPLPQERGLFRRASQLVVVDLSRMQPVKPLALPVPGRVDWPSAACVVTAEPWRGLIRPPPGRPGIWPAEATVRRPRPGERLAVRTWRPGDRVALWGLDGRTKVQDLFGNMKVPREQRAGLPIIVSGREIVWVPGSRVARAWAVPGASSPSVRLRVLPA
jgi:tRNA(Ile)-lysidine synthase